MKQLMAVCLILTSVILASSTPTAGGVREGEWVGTTSQGHEISFTISGTTFSQITVTITYTCPFEGEFPNTVGWGTAPIEGSEFLLLLNMTEEGDIMAGSPIAVSIPGRFTSGTSAEGGLTSARAVFTGRGRQTKGCSADGITWSAEWRGVALPSAAAHVATQARSFASNITESSGPLIAQPPKGRGLASPLPVVPQDGEWSGRTSQSNEISFFVEDTGSTILGGPYVITIHCPIGDGQTWGTGHGGRFPVRNGRFRMLGSRETTGRIMRGATFAVIIPGMFTLETTAQGSLISDVATFKGRGLRTQACTDRGITWSAEWVSPASP